MTKLFNLLPWRRRRLERDLDRELAYHVERRIDDLVQSGLSADEARRTVGVEFGARLVVQEEARDAWAWRWLPDRGRDARCAMRSLARRPGFTVTAVLSLAIGIGASAATFSLVDQVLFRLLPVKEPERLVLVDWVGPQFADGRGSGNLLSYPLCRDLQDQQAFFEGVFCRHPTTVNLADGNESRPVAAEIVSGTYFPVLGVRPALGRLLDSSDDVHPGAHPVVVLAYDYWRTEFGGAPDVVGRTIRINNHPMTIVGVADPAFRGVDLGEVPALWMPTMMKRQAMPEWSREPLDRRARWMHVFGRLAPGVTADAAKAGLQPWFTQMLHSEMALDGFPQISESQRDAFVASTIEVMPAAHGRSNLRNSLGGPLWVLMAGTLLLHLLASANVAGLLLARGATRVRELQVRMALGASRSRVTGLLLADGLLVAVCGGFVGLLAAPVVSNVLLSFLPQDVASVDLTARIDGRVFAFATVAGLVTATLCGFALAWQASRIPLMASLKERAGSASGGLRLRKALVMGQLAFTLVLLVGAGLFVQTLARLETKGPGFSTTHLLTFGLNAQRVGYTGEASHRLLRDVLAALQEAPEFESAALSGNGLLFGGSWNANLTIEADMRITTDRVVHLNSVSPGFFATLGTRIIAGRDFDDRDARPVGETETVLRSIVVNESFARRYFGDDNPIGRRVGLGANTDTRTDIEIVGVVRDFSYRNLREESEHAFVAFFESSGPGAWYYLRARGRPESAVASVRAAIDRIEPGLPLLDLRSFDDQVARSLTTERMLATLSAGFGVIALLLSAVGLYGVMSFVVTSRTQEIGIRLALGATPASAMRRVVRDAAVMVGVGAAIALPGLWGVSRVVQSQLYGVEPLDARTIAAAGGVLALVALAGTLLPAWRAASVRPTDALRSE